MAPGSSADDIRPLFDLMGKHPELFTDTDKQLAEASLKETIGVVEFNRREFDPESLREEASAFEPMAAQLGIDISARISNIEEYADEQESEWHDKGSDLIHFGSHADKEEWCGDDTIASLFSTIPDQ